MGGPSGILRASKVRDDSPNIKYKS